MHRRTEITIETERLLVVKQHQERAILWCNQCADNVPMLPIYEAVKLAGFPEAGLLHFVVTPENQLFICSRSFDFETAQESSLTEPVNNPTL
ncbi:MAG: hypothetical protein QOD75_717 [Blastocatellia bacterium]|jgi:hypothetical protein|nr:hypothetical protein [Blastocatellia bacterium]